MGGQERSQLWWTERIAFGAGSTAVIAGICSPLLSFGDGEQGQLFASSYQANDVTGADAELRIALVHHPLDWLSDLDVQAKTRIMSWADVLLHGHVHRADAADVARRSGTTLVVGAGSCYQGSNYENGCQMLEFDLQVPEARVTIYRWVAHDGRWIVSRDQYPGSATGVGAHPLPLAK
jgi:hypothetical protein